MLEKSKSPTAVKNRHKFLHPVIIYYHQNQLNISQFRLIYLENSPHLQHRHWVGSFRRKSKVDCSPVVMRTPSGSQQCERVMMRSFRTVSRQQQHSLRKPVGVMTEGWTWLLQSPSHLLIVTSPLQVRSRRPSSSYSSGIFQE